MNSFENLKNVEHAPGVGYYDVPVEYARQDQINIWDEEQKQDKYNFNKPTNQDFLNNAGTCGVNTYNSLSDTNNGGGMGGGQGGGVLDSWLTEGGKGTMEAMREEHLEEKDD